jgi:hypothetical protein
MVSYKLQLTILIENWYEDRLALEQPYKAEPEKRVMREFESSINCINGTGLPHPLKRI